MNQMEIQYFWPLTEQIPLDLDYTKSLEYIEKKRKEQISNSVIGGGTGYAFVTVASNIEPNFTIDIDQVPITVVSKQKPGLFRRYIYKILGMKWKAK
jgi:hypothetical protein